MDRIGNRRIGFLIAVIAAVAVLLFLLMPHGHANHVPLWLVSLPVLFVGLISPMGFFSPHAYLDLGCTPEESLQRSSFQRPPPLKNCLIL
jgi:hypothetical protein